jgi:hypothetical protein
MRKFFKPPASAALESTLVAWRDSRILFHELERVYSRVRKTVASTRKLALVRQICLEADDIQADTTTATLINKPLRVSHDTLGRVRSLESRFLPLRPILTSFEEVADGLEILGQGLVARGCVTGGDQRLVDLHLENAKRYARTLRRTVIFLQERSNNTATLLSDTLAFRNQGVAQDQNGSMVVLTRSAVFITVITLVYLPWTLATVCRLKCW